MKKRDFQVGDFAIVVDKIDHHHDIGEVVEITGFYYNGSKYWATNGVFAQLLKDCELLKLD